LVVPWFLAMLVLGIAQQIQTMPCLNDVIISLYDFAAKEAEEGMRHY
jgi:hypothetical protein